VGVHVCVNLDYVRVAFELLLRFYLAVHCIFDYRVATVLRDYFEGVFFVVWALDGDDAAHCALAYLSADEVGDPLNFDLVLEEHTYAWITI
jgi:hypothetical protein